MVVIRMGRKRSSGRLDGSPRRDRAPSLRSRSSATSIIMMAFFLTMPISSSTPIMAMMLNSTLVNLQRQQRADAGRRQGRQDRDGVDVALVEDAEHDVDGRQRRQHQQELVVQRSAGRRAPCPGTIRAMVVGMPISRIVSFTYGDGVAQRLARRQVEGDGAGHEQALMIHGQRRRAVIRSVVSCDSGISVSGVVLMAAPVETPSCGRSTAIWLVRRLRTAWAGSIVSAPVPPLLRRATSRSPRRYRRVVCVAAHRTARTC